MTAFRVETVYGLPSLRVFHINHLPRAVACICPADGDAVDLVPILFEGMPKPLTGREQRFDTLADALAYLGISEDAREAEAA